MRGLALALSLLSTAALAKYAAVETKPVPIARLLANAEKDFKKAPKDFAVLARNARLNAMAATLAGEKAEVPVHDGEDEPWYGHQPRHVPYAEGKAAAGKARLEKAVDFYRRALAVKPDDIVTELGLAWTLEQSGKTDEAKNRYRKVVEAGWKAEKDKMEGFGKSWSLTEEAIGYLKPLLDPAKDAAEIQRYDERLKVIAAKPRSITPVLVALGPGPLVDAKARVGFDLDGRAPHACAWDWPTPAAGILVYDPEGKGDIRSGLQLFGSVSWWVFWENGYQALAALDDDGDGGLRGTELAGIRVWRDADGDAVSQPGEVQDLTAYGITAIGVRDGMGVIMNGRPAAAIDWIARCR
jgi:tetratricopeptide (TPR) repeat protein